MLLARGIAVDEEFLIDAHEHPVERVLQQRLGNDVGILLVLLVNFREIIGAGADFGDDPAPVGFPFGFQTRRFASRFVERPSRRGAGGADFAAAILFGFNHAGKGRRDLPGWGEGQHIHTVNANAECESFGALAEFGVDRAAQ